MAEQKIGKIVRTGEWEYRVEAEENAGGSHEGAVRGIDDLRKTIFSLQDQGYEVRLVDCDLASEGLDDTMDQCPECGRYHEMSDLPLGGGCDCFIGLYGEGEIHDFPDYERFAEAWQALEDLYHEIPEHRRDSFQKDLKAWLEAGGFDGTDLAGLDFPYDSPVMAFQNLFDLVLGSETGEDGTGEIGLYSRDPDNLSARIATFCTAADDLSGRYPREESEKDLEDNSGEEPEV